MKSIFFYTLLLVSFSVRAQRFDSVLNVLDTRFPQEKIHVHFDKSIYSPGETIWLKAYLFAGSFPSGISKTVYAELLDEQGKLLDRKTAPTVLSGAETAFDLPFDLKSSMVYVRVYTRWMLNFDTAFLFVKPIPVVGSVKSKTASTTGKPANTNTSSATNTASQSASPTAFLQFFPEGGDLVTGLSSKLAFKATDNRGIPIKVKGDVVSSSGKKIPFESVHDGMGYITIQPQQDEQYKAIWKDPSGRGQETILPAALQWGIVIKTENRNNQIDFEILKTPDAPHKAVFVVAQMHQQLLYRARANLASRVSANGSIPLQDLPTGIIQITVFSEDEKPLAERLVFVNHDDYYFITDLNAPTKSLVKHGKNVIQIDVPDTIVSNLSVSVTDARINPPVKGEDDIFSHLLLTSDIKGYVHEPAYYFSGADSAFKHLDLVMLTNGWRRFKWEDALAGRWPVLKNPAEDYMGIRGKVSGIDRSSLMNKELTGMMELKKGGTFFITIPIRPDGTFSVPEAVYFDTAKIFYQINNDKNKTLTNRGVFEFRNTFLNQPLSAIPAAEQYAYAQNVDEKVAATTTDISNRRQLQEDARRKVQTLATVEVKAKKKTRQEEMDEEYTSPMFRSLDARIFVIEDDPAAQAQMNVLYYLQARVPGLTIRMGGPNGAQLSWRGGTPGLYLNEMQVDAGMLESTPMSDIAMVKVFAPPFFGGFGGGSGGAIAVYTKKGRAATESVKGLDVAKVPGYSNMKQFYSPDYANYEQTNNDVDYRTTLYWNPAVYTNKQNRRILITFYNNDITNRIRVVVEGTNVDGKLTRIEKIFE
jgi:hypothetical protein